MAQRPPFEPSLDQPYPLIDSDPHFARVVRYMRPVDYASWGILTAGGPALLWGWEWMEGNSRKGLGPAMRLMTLIGFTGGFLFAYQSSSQRFWGWRENAREVQKDFAEMTQRVKDGKPLYGHTDMSDYMQGVAHRNSAFSQLKLQVMPWFNVVNHKYHGVDPSIYGATSTSGNTKEKA